MAVLDAERANAVVEHRRRIRKPLTPHAARLIAGKLAQWPDPNEAADAMIANGWQGFEPDWLARQTSSAARQPKPPPQEDGFMQALRADLDRERNRYEPDHNPTRYIDASEPGADQPSAHVVDIFAATSRRW